MSSGLDAVRDALAEVRGDGGFQPRRVTLAPVAPLPPPERTPATVGDRQGEPEAASSPAATAPGEASADGGGVAAPGHDQTRLPGTPKGHRRLLAVNLPAATRHRLDTARGHPPVRTRADVVLDALAATFDAIAEERRSQLAAPQSRFAPSNVRRRRLALDDPRDVPIQFAPEEAAAVKEAADELALTVSALITDALDRHLANGVQPTG